METNKLNNKTIGNIGESIALKHIEEQGFFLIEKNFRFGNDGEIDIVAQDKDMLVFIEVKTRTNHSFGNPIMSVTKKKQHFLRRAAEGYMFKRKILNTPCRMDVIAIDLIDKKNPVITHLKNAF